MVVYDGMHVNFFSFVEWVHSRKKRNAKKNKMQKISDGTSCIHAYACTVKKNHLSVCLFYAMSMCSETQRNK